MAEDELITAEVISELLATEREYNKNLRALIENYLLPVKQHNMLKPEQIKAVFANAIELFNSNTAFLNHLERCTTIIEIANLFITWSENFSTVYSTFCGNYASAIKELAICTEDTWEYEQFNKLLKANKAKPELNSWTLDTFLIKPSNILFRSINPIILDFQI